MKNWLNYFKIWFLVCGIIIVICLIPIISFNAKNSKSSERVNEVCTETERVFDYADKLTDEEEDSLRALIAEKEQEAKCDIVLLVMDEPLEEYAYQYDPDSYGEEWTMIKADNFYDENGFGWNKHVESDDGDGVILLDNWYRESDGAIHTWLSTSGSVQERYSSGMIDRLLDRVYSYLPAENPDPYQAYAAYVETIAEDMSGAGKKDLPVWPVVVIPLIVAVVFIGINLSGKEGKKTTVATSYVEGGKPNFRVSDDHFIRTTTSTRHIDTSSSSGGGGGGSHVSSGGHSHGGGGHSR